MQLEQIIRRLNPQAKILLSRESSVPLQDVMGTGLFWLSEAENSPDWLEVPRGQEQTETETEEYGISHFVYRRSRPFHAARLGGLVFLKGHGHPNHRDTVHHRSPDVPVGEKRLCVAIDY